MVESEQDMLTGRRRIILRPNASMTEGEASIFLAAAALVMGTIAIGFASLGLWLVLPFSGAEWLLLALCFRASFRKAAHREIISIDDQAVVVEQGCRGPEQTYRFHRAWLAVDWTRPSTRGHPSRLLFRLHGRQVEVGKFLVETEREALARELQQLLANNKI